MHYPYCAAITIRKRTKKTKLGYTTFFYPSVFVSPMNELCTSLNYLAFRSDFAFLAVLWRLRY